MKSAQNRVDAKAPTTKGKSKRPSTEIVLMKRRVISNGSDVSQRINSDIIAKRSNAALQRPGDNSARNNVATSG
jgi:hypothetical protein